METTRRFSRRTFIAWVGGAGAGFYLFGRLPGLSAPLPTLLMGPLRRRSSAPGLGSSRQRSRVSRYRSERLPGRTVASCDQPAAKNGWICATLPCRRKRRRACARRLQTARPTPGSCAPDGRSLGRRALPYQLRTPTLSRADANPYQHMTARRGAQRITADLTS